MADSGQKFIKRNRPPRVQIAYEDPYDAEKLVELPFIMGVMSDLSGNNAGSEKPDFAERDFMDIDMDNFDARMSKIEPGVQFHAKNRLSDDEDSKMSVNLRFKKMSDMEPAAIARQVPELAKLLEMREQLSNLMRYMDGKVAAEDKLQELLKDPALMAALSKKREESSDSSE